MGRWVHSSILLVLEQLAIEFPNIIWRILSIKKTNQAKE